MTMRVAIGRRECTRKEDRCVLYPPQTYECRNTSPSALGHRSRCVSLQISSCAGILISPNAFLGSVTVSGSRFTRASAADSEEVCVKSRPATSFPCQIKSCRHHGILGSDRRS